MSDNLVLGPRPAITIVIPTRNRLRFLEESLTSIRDQTFSEWEAIVVDDCSSDQTWRWLTGIKDPRFRPFRMEKPSERSTARNRGLEVARGEFVLFLDDDDRLMPRALQYLIGWHRRKPDAIAVVGGRCEFDDHGHRRRAPHSIFPVKRGAWEEIMFGWIPGVGQSSIRTIAVRDVGGWNSRFAAAEHHDLWLRLSKVGKAMVVPGVVLECRAHGGQWRAEDMTLLEELMRERSLEHSSGSDRLRGESLLAARRLKNRAGMEHAQNNCRQAAVNYTKAIRTFPTALMFPTMGPALAGDFAKAALGVVLGKGGTRAVKRSKAFARHLLRREPGAARQITAVSTSGDLSKRCFDGSSER